MPRLVSLLLFTLLLFCASGPAARLPEIQAAGSSKTGATLQSNRTIRPSQGRRAHAAETLAVNAAQANVEGTPVQSEIPQNLPSADRTDADTAINAPALELAASSASSATNNTEAPTMPNPKDPVIDNQKPDKSRQGRGSRIISGSRRPGVIEHQIVRTNGC